MGGNQGSSSQRNDAFDTISGTWSSKAPLPKGIVEPGGVVQVPQNGFVYVISGTCRSPCGDTPTNAVQVYNPFTDAWSSASSIPTQRNRAGVAVITMSVGPTLKPFIFVMGGYPGQAGGVVPALNVVEAYDVNSNSWLTTNPITGTPFAPMPTAREGLFAATIGGKIYAIGGLTDSRSGSTATNVVEIYDPLSNTWSTGPSMPTPRGIVMGSVSCESAIVVMGGINGNSLTLATTEAYSPQANAWTTEPSMPTARAEAGAAVVGGTTYIVEGFLSSPGAGTN